MSKDVARLPTSRLIKTGDLRTFLANIALAVSQGDMEIRNAVVAVKACEQINASLYSEAKIMAMALAAGNQPPKLGDLDIRGGTL